MADRKRIVLTDEIMNDYLDTANTKSLNEMMFKAYEGEIADIKKSNPKLKDASFETAIIECYRRRESSVEEALI